jgi:hypothetical protein
MRNSLFSLIITALVTSSTSGCTAGAQMSWQEEFRISECALAPTGRSRYLILEPGYQLVLEGDDTKLQITVLNETKLVDGITTRVVEEREWKDGALYEVSRNYFAICPDTKDVFYFGEDVDFYEGDKIVKHDGSWLAGVNGNKPGLIMPGSPTVGMRYYQEIAPSVAMDRAEVVSITDTCKTPAGTFANCLKVEEGSALEPGVEEDKYHAPDIGLVQDEDLRLIRYGFLKQ